LSKKKTKSQNELGVSGDETSFSIESKSKLSVDTSNNQSVKVKSTEKLPSNEKIKKKSFSEKKYKIKEDKESDKNQFVGFNNSEDLGKF
jgi:hypothetical protein